MRRRLGNLERQFLAYAQLRKVRELRTGDFTKPLGITAKQERELYSRLGRAGLIAQVRRGLYLIPRELPLGGAWTPDEALALNTLMADRSGRSRRDWRVAEHKAGARTSPPATPSRTPASTSWQCPYRGSPGLRLITSPRVLAHREEPAGPDVVGDSPPSSSTWA